MISSPSIKCPIHALLLLGPTGVGKTPLGNALEKNGLFGRQCYHLDFGSELRAAVSEMISADYFTNEERDFINQVLAGGSLLEDSHFPLAVKIISLFLQRTGFSGSDILILNGIPRHTGQADAIASIVYIHALIVLDCSPEAVFWRISGNVGGDRDGRTDDDQEMIRRKLILFSERTAPLIEYYKTRGRPIYRISICPTTAPDIAYQDILTLAAAHPPIAFITEPPER